MAKSGYLFLQKVHLRCKTEYTYGKELCISTIFPLIEEAFRGGWPLEVGDWL